MRPLLFYEGNPYFKHDIQARLQNYIYVYRYTILDGKYSDDILLLVDRLMSCLDIISVYEAFTTKYPVDFAPLSLYYYFKIDKSALAYTIADFLLAISPRNNTLVQHIIDLTGRNYLRTNIYAVEFPVMPLIGYASLLSATDIIVPVQIG